MCVVMVCVCVVCVLCVQLCYSVRNARSFVRQQCGSQTMGRGGRAGGGGGGRACVVEMCRLGVFA